MSNKVRSMQREIEKRKFRDGVIATTLGELIQSEQSLGVLIDQQLPIRASFQISKIVKAASVEIAQYQESRKLLCERHSNKDEDGKAIMLGNDNNPVAEGQPGRYDIPADKMPEFEKEHAELMATEVSIPGTQVKISELGSVTIAPANLMTLDWLITE